MGKLGVAAASTGVAGTGGTAIYAAHHFGAFGSSGSSSRGVAVMGNTPDQFRTNPGKCFHPHIGKIFDKWADKGALRDITESNKPKDVASTSDVKLDESSSQPKGCVEYRWDIANSEDKWKGSNFRFVWVLSRGNKAFSVYLTGWGKDTKSVEFDGVAYAFSRDDSGWKVTHQMNVKSENKTLSNGDIKTKFPKKGDVWLSGSWGVNEYWRFMEDSGEEMNKNLGHGDNVGWFEHTGGTEVKQWSKNLDVWWPHFFDDTKWKMTDVVSSIKGSWKP